MYIDDEYLTLGQIYDEIANNDLLDLRVRVERDGKNLVLSKEILSMFFPDSNGRLRPLLDTSGRVTEASAGAIATSQVAIDGRLEQISNQGPELSVGGTFPGATEAWRGKHKIQAVPFALAGGSQADLVLVTAVAGYKVRILIRGVVCDTGIAPLNMNFQDEDNNDLAGQVAGGYDVTLVADTMNYQLEGALLSCGTADKDGEVDLTGGAGVETGFVIIEWWMEA